ncbi:hypothetical protein CJ030_MR1G020894 [Morella rubra]|uniref:Uncharacterized protein n=1 Tax=Morella rubra TaxID=262757 RepID=A0A6A1WQ25_9ROSI|nr:hypothetical protein CJ030_MR1G020894 [Morella rubra]
MAPQQRPCLACQPACHRHAMTAHGLAMTRCHSKSLATNQAKQEQRANRQRSAITQDGHPPVVEHHHPYRASGKGRGKGHRVKEHHHPWRQAAAAPPWTAADDAKIQEGL